MAGGRCAAPPSSAAGRRQSRPPRCLRGSGGQQAVGREVGRVRTRSDGGEAAAAAAAAQYHWRLPCGQAADPPGNAEGAVRTVKMDGSGWSKLTAFTAMQRQGRGEGYCHIPTRHKSGMWAVALRVPSCKESQAGEVRPDRHCRAVLCYAGVAARLAWAEPGQVIFVWSVVAVPGDHVEGREGLGGCREGGRGAGSGPGREEVRERRLEPKGT